MKETEIDFDRYIIYEDGRIFSKAKNDFMEETPNVYGYIQNNYKLKDGSSSRLYRHRVIWTYFNGEIPDVLEIDHIVPIRNGGSNSLDNLHLTDKKGNANNPLTIENKKIYWEKGLAKETKLKMSVSAKNRLANKENHPMYGKRHSEESKLKNKLSQINRKPVAQIDATTGEIIKIWKSIREIEKLLGFNHCNISKCCRGITTLSHGFKWSFV